MRVIIICKEPFPNGMAATSRIKCYAKALMLSGIACQVVIFARTEKKGQARNSDLTGSVENIPYIHLGSSTIKPSHKIPRLFHKYMDEVLLTRYLKKNLNKGDIVIGFLNADIDFMCHTIKVIHSKGAHYVKELSEIPFFGDQSSRGKKGLQKALGNMFPMCDGFLSISTALTELAEENKSSAARIFKLPILVNFPDFDLPDRSSEADVPYIFHSGTLYEQKDGVIGMIEAFGRARHQTGKDIKMYMTGRLEQSPEKARIKELIKEYDLEDSLVFTGFLSDHQLKEYLSKASLVVINKHQNIQNRYCFSTKLAEYLAAGKALVITDVGEAMNYLEDGKNAIVVHEGDNDALAQAIIKAFSDDSLRDRIGAAGKELCRNSFDYRSVSAGLSDFLRSL